MYCGIGKVPKGKMRGTPDYCIKSKQVRYYGKHRISSKLLGSKSKKLDLQKEELKLRKLSDNAKTLLKQIKIVKIIIDVSTSTSKEKKNAEKELEKLLKKKDNLIKRRNKQLALVKSIK